MSRYTDREKAAEAQRELSMRMIVYERQIQIGAISKAEAERRIDLMREIAQDYYDRAGEGQLKLKL
jgi:hypothetical protein